MAPAQICFIAGEVVWIKEVEILKTAVSIGREKNSSRLLLVRCRGFPVSGVARVLSVSVPIYTSKSGDPPDKEASIPKEDGTTLLPLILDMVAIHTTYGYRRILRLCNWYLERMGNSPINHKQVCQIMKRHNLLLNHYTGKNLIRSHTGNVMVSPRNRLCCADGFEIVCDNRERVRVLFDMDYCDREVIAFSATTCDYSADIVQSMLLAYVEPFLQSPPARGDAMDNGSFFTLLETRNFVRELRVECRFTPVCSPQRNGMAESFVKTFKRDYVFCHALTDVVSVIRQISA